MGPVTDTRAETKLYSLLLKTQRVTLTNEIETLENSIKPVILNLLHVS